MRLMHICLLSVAFALGMLTMTILSSEHMKRLAIYEPNASFLKNVLRFEDTTLGLSNHTDDHEGLTFSDLNQTQEQCVAMNICRNKSENSNIFYYNRTSFDVLLDKPIDLNTSVQHPFPIVPRIVHFLLFSNGSEDFRFSSLIAVLAAARFAKPEKVFFWHDNLPVGKYWQEAMQEVTNMVLIRRQRPTSIYGNPVKVVEHASDIVRLEALLEFGGMYFDMDAIVVNSIEPLLYYDVTLGHETQDRLANGIMFSKPWSDFLMIWHKEYKNFDDNDWAGWSVILPFEMSRVHPNLIHIEPRSLCRPNWEELDYLFGEKIWDWKNKNYVVHLYMRFAAGQGNNEEEIQTWNTTAGSVMRYIYYGDASLWPEKQVDAH